MASNPMQRKVRNSFFLGILSMLAITVLIGVIVFLLVIKPNMDKKKEEENQITAYVYKLKSGVGVESGEKITSSMVESVEIVVKNTETDFIIAKTEDEKTGELIDNNFPSGYKSKIALEGEAVLTYSMLYKEEATPASLRYVEYNMITIPTTLDTGSYIDIRLRLPNGHDLVVVSKKEIINLYDQTVGLNLTEDEIVILNSAIVETYIMNGAAELYMSTYVEPGIQTAAVYTYMPTNEVITLINMNQNIIAEARTELAMLYSNQGVADVRGQLNNSLTQYDEDKSENIESGIQKQIEAARKAREEYLSELEGY